MKEIRAYHCGGAKQEELLAKGWQMILAEFRETPQELYNRLAKAGYDKIKICWTGTAVRNIHHYFAFVKK